VYNEQTRRLLLKYFKGTREQDKTGNQVELAVRRSTTCATCCCSACNGRDNNSGPLHSFRQHRHPAVSDLFKDQNRFPTSRDPRYFLHPGASSAIGPLPARKPDFATFNNSGKPRHGGIEAQLEHRVRYRPRRLHVEGERNMYQIKDDLAIAARCS